MKVVNFDYLGFRVVSNDGITYVIDNETGEKIIGEEAELFINKKRSKVFQKGGNAVRLLGFEDIKTIRDRKSDKAYKEKNNKGKWKMGENFIKIYNDFDINTVSISEAGFLLKLFPYVEWKTNLIRDNNKPFFKKELQKIIGVGKNKFIDLIKSLESKNFIKTVDYINTIDIYINPNIYTFGNEIEEETLKMFGLIED